MHLARTIAAMTILVAACGSSDDAAPEPADPASPPTVEATSPRTIEIAGNEADLHLPPESNEAAPVVVMLHGTEGDRTRMNPLAAAVAADGSLVYVPSCDIPAAAGSVPGWPSSTSHRGRASTVTPTWTIDRHGSSTSPATTRAGTSTAPRRLGAVPTTPRRRSGRHWSCNSRTGGDVEMWFALVSVRTDADSTESRLLEDSGRLGLDNPEWVDFGGFVLYCHPDPAADHPWANWMFPAGVLTPDEPTD